MWRQVLALIVKELLAVLRDAKSRSVLILPPLIQLMVFGYAATYDLDHVPMAIYDEDGSQASRDLVAHFLGAPTFHLVAMLHSSREIDALIDSRQVALALVIDPRFTRGLLTGQPAPVQAILDGRNSNSALLIEGYANTILSDFSIAWAAAHGGANPPATLDIRARYNPTLSSHWFFVPSIVALLTQIVTLLVVALSVARERETGTFDQLLVTPLRPIDILLGKGLPGVLIGVVEATVIIVAAVWWFEVPLRGGLLPLYLGLLVFVIAVTGMGLMISELAATMMTVASTTPISTPGSPLPSKMS
ncbi:MAG: ABC transporter permease, partial [Roseiarcus sp.]